MMITAENRPIGKSIKEADADHLNSVITELTGHITEPIAIPFGVCKKNYSITFFLGMG
jgi:hypothetical protein